MGNIKQYLQKLIAKWDKYGVYGGAEAVETICLEEWKHGVNYGRLYPNHKLLGDKKTGTEIRCIKCGKTAREGESLNSNIDGSFIECDDCMWRPDQPLERIPEETKIDMIDLEVLRVQIYNWVSNVNVADDIWGKVNKELDKAREEERQRVVGKILVQLSEEIDRNGCKNIRSFIKQVKEII